MSASNCWATGKCTEPGHSCFVKFKSEHGGYARCHKECPASWNCETRSPEGGCGPAPLPEHLASPSSWARSILPAGVSICDRRSPPQDAPVFETTCYDGGFTGNRYLMIKNMLTLAACCAGVAVLPPSFDGLPDAGASCLDMRALSANGTARLSLPSPAACEPRRASSKHWWHQLVKETPKGCAHAHATAVRTAAAAYSGVAHPTPPTDSTPGTAIGRQCAHLERALVIQARNAPRYSPLDGAFGVGSVLFVAAPKCAFVAAGGAPPRRRAYAHGMQP
eukprot:2287794-Pleurochrysis_carterae.AAC.2